MADQPISEAFYAAVEAIAAIVGVSPIRGLHQVETEGWKLTINASMQPVVCGDVAKPVGPYEIHAEGKIYLAVVIIDPFGGMLGGIDEASFIAEMQAITAARAALPA